MNNKIKAGLLGGSIIGAGLIARRAIAKKQKQKEDDLNKEFESFKTKDQREIDSKVRALAQRAQLLIKTDGVNSAETQKVLSQIDDFSKKYKSSLSPAQKGLLEKYEKSHKKNQRIKNLVTAGSLVAGAGAGLGYLYHKNNQAKKEK